MNYKVSQRSW